MPITFHYQPGCPIFEIKKDGERLAMGCQVKRPESKSSEWGVMLLVLPPEDIGYFPDVPTARRATVQALKARGVRP